MDFLQERRLGQVLLFDRQQISFAQLFITY